MASEETKIIRILGHNIEYCYHDNFDGIMDECDREHISKLIGGGYIERELVTSDPDPTIDEDHYGWWKIPVIRQIEDTGDFHEAMKMWRTPGNTFED